MHVLRLTLLGVALCSVLALPASALPNCGTIGQTDCNATCAILNQGVGSCAGVVYPQCGTNSQPFTYYCSWGGTYSGWCTCQTGGGGGGCFLEGTEITLADGSVKPIEKIEVGDVVLAYDEESGEMKPDRVKAVHDPVPSEYYILVNGATRLTASHPVLSQGEWVEIGTLKVGDMLTDAQGRDVPIESLETVKEDVTVYNFAVNPYETYVADGFIVHNKPPDISDGGGG